MKIALVSANLFAIGGVENHIRFVGRELERLGHELRLFKPTWRDELERARSLDAGIPTDVIDLGEKPYEQRRLRLLARFPYAQGFMKRAAFSFAAARVRDAVAQWAPDLVWQHDFSSSWLGCRLLAREYPLVLTNHTGEFLLLKRLPAARHVLHALMRHYRAVIGPSRELTPAFHAESHTIHNGVDLEFFTPASDVERRRLRETLTGSDDTFIVFCPRRWAPTKGVLYLARAVATVAASTPNVKFVFAGSDYELYREYAESVRGALSGSERFVMEVGNLDLDGMRRWYRAADLVVIPSLMEAVSLAALEAMACGAPVLSTDVGGMPEIIDPERTGVLVPPSDSVALASAITRLAADRGLLHNLRQNALDLVRGSYSWQAIARATERVLLDAHAPS